MPSGGYSSRTRAAPPERLARPAGHRAGCGIMPFGTSVIDGTSCPRAPIGLFLSSETSASVAVCFSRAPSILSIVRSI